MKARYGVLACDLGIADWLNASNHFPKSGLRPGIESAMRVAPISAVSMASIGL